MYTACLPFFLCAAVFAQGDLPVSENSSGSAVTVKSPLIGYLPAPSGLAIWTMTGQPGAARLSASLTLPPAIHRTLFAPGNASAVAVIDYGLAVLLTADGLPAPDGDGKLPLTPVEHTANCKGPIAFSPTGSAVAVYCQNDGVIRTISGWPDTPAVAAEFAAPVPARLAVSDDASSVVAAGETGAALFQVGRDPAALPEPLSAATFLPGVARFVTAGSEVLLYSIGEDGPESRLLATPEEGTTVSAIQPGSSGAEVLLLANSRVWHLALEDGVLTALDTAVAATRLTPLADPDTFVYSAGEGEPVWILTGRLAQPRVYPIPAVKAQ